MAVLLRDVKLDVFFTCQTFYTNCYLLRVELRCKLQEKLQRVAVPSRSCLPVSCHHQMCHNVAPASNRKIEGLIHQSYQHVINYISCQEKVLHNIMSIFTFMGVSVLRQDDTYSFQIIKRTVEAVIPALVQVRTLLYTYM